MDKAANKTQRAFIYIAIITVVSKILGFFRETSIASAYGANAATDSYIVAVTIVTSFYLIIGDVINNTFIPQYLRLKKEDKTRSDRFASSIINIILLASIILMIVCGWFTDKLVFLYAPGLTPADSLQAAAFTRFLLPTLVITGISIAVRSTLQANNSFIGPAIMGIPNHAVVIGYLMLGNMYGIKGLVFATAIGTSVQLFVQLPFVKATGFRYIGPGYYEHRDVRKFVCSMGFILVGSSVNQINTLVDRALASYTGQGNISILNYANMLNLFVYAVFITSITTVIFPLLSESKDNSDLESKVAKYIRIIIAVLVPVSILTMFFSYEAVSVLFGRGSFTEQNIIDTARVLSAYSLGIIPFGVSEVLNRTFYSLEMPKTTMKIGILAVFSNITMNLILVKYMGIIGLALATSFASVVYMTVSLKSINKRLAILNRSLLKWVMKAALMACASFAALYTADMLLEGIVGTGLPFVILRVAAASIAALALYGLLMYKYGGFYGD